MQDVQAMTIAAIASMYGHTHLHSTCGLIFFGKCIGVYNLDAM